MCDPTVLAIASIGASAAGSFQQAQAQKQQAQYQAAVARNNSIIAERQAEDARARGEKEELTFRRKLAQTKGRQMTDFAASGVIIDTGSPLDVIASTAELGEEDALTIRESAEREAHGFETQAFNFQQQSRVSEATASNINPFLEAGGTALTGASRNAQALGFG